jgi:hypothetical protein
MTGAWPRRRPRRYLSGTDWAIHALDWRTRRATGTGNLSQVVLDLDGTGSGDRIRELARAFFRELPVVRGTIRRDLLNLAPFWSMDGAGDGALDPVRDAEATGPARPLAERLAALVNEPLGGPRDHLALRVLTGDDGRDCVVLTFDHRLLDGRGAELLLALLDRYAAVGPDALLPEHRRPESPSGVDDWRAKFAAGRVVNRAARARAGGDMAELPMPPPRAGAPFRFRVLTFGEDETAAIDERVRRDAGYLLVMPFLLAAAARSLRGAFAAHLGPRSEFVVAVTGDARGATPAPGTLFFNHVTFLFFSIPCASLDDSAAVISGVVRQMYDQVRARHPQCYAEASQLMRILPVPLLAALQEPFFRGSTGSFCLSYVGGADFSREEFAGVRTRNLVHMPRVAVPPGIGVFFNRFRGRINATFSWLDGMLDDSAADDVVSALRTALLGRGGRA